MNRCQGLGSKMLRCCTFKVKLRLDRLSVLKADRSSTTIYIPVKALGCFRLRFVMSSFWAASAQFAFVLPEMFRRHVKMYLIHLFTNPRKKHKIHKHKTSQCGTRQADANTAESHMYTIAKSTNTKKIPSNSFKFKFHNVHPCPLY